MFPLDLKDINLKMTLIQLYSFINVAWRKLCVIGSVSKIVLPIDKCYISFGTRSVKYTDEQPYSWCTKMCFDKCNIPTVFLDITLITMSLIKCTNGCLCTD